MTTTQLPATRVIVVPVLVDAEGRVLLCRMAGDRGVHAPSQ